MPVTHVQVSSCQSGNKFPERPWELKLTPSLLNLEVLSQVVSYIDAGVCWGPTQGQFIKAKTIQAYTEVQEVLPGGGFGSKLVVAN